MSDAAGRGHVFLSYAREDRLAAERIARAIEQQGFSVWWDIDIPAGVHYAKHIEEGLKSAACVLVLWSRRSTQSRWVRNEADWGAEKDRLIPVLIDDAEIPWEFRNFQALNLAGWSGDESDPSFARLIRGLRRRLAVGNAVPGTPRSSEEETPGSAAVGPVATAGPGTAAPAPSSSSKPAPARPRPPGRARAGAPPGSAAPLLRRTLLLAGLLLAIIVAIVALLQISDRLARRKVQPPDTSRSWPSRAPADPCARLDTASGRPFSICTPSPTGQDC
ncbi:MAG: toll/interleukin-1 receptor domain-containing protein [Candidatus Eisenbacteria bacterium]|uniref:Toll/interleukin-1 receptor domain-containing protein n=1 Tax=Eiseniibacteriota bacterium TaxID=2212470 RepID=A0A937XAP0_UNCEI|nr:toll/interleukin-1 receptor domain-containing protein [Candidatus Eisenbacteria bacterium]